MEYTKEVSTYKSQCGDSTIFYYTYTPKVPLRGIVQLSHGMCEYVERYEEFAKFLAQNGFIFCGNDHLGHGKTGEYSNIMGYFDEKDGWKSVVQDVNTLTDIMKRKYPNLPYFLFGHSMGSFVAREYIKQFGDKLDGIIISGTSGANPMVGFGIALAHGISKTKGKLYRSKLLKKMSFKDYNKKYQDSKHLNDWISRDVEIVEKYARDKRCNFTFTASAYEDMFRLLQSVSSKKWYEKVPKNLPILLLSGDMDPVGNFGKGVKEVYDNLKKANIKDLEIKLYKDGRHEMINEINRQEVCADIVNWFEKHM